jgi:SAM-dependent methyltransferase
MEGRLTMTTCSVCLLGDLGPAFAREGYDYLRCDACGTISVAPLPTPDDLRAYYNTSYRVDPRGAENGSRRKWRRLIGEVRRHGVPRGRVLEIGCSWGGFLAAATESGWEACGVDLSTEATAHARERLGLQAFAGSLEESPFGEGGFDAVVMWHVIEHQRDPRGFLRSCASRLKPGGVLLLTTPNAASLIARVSGAAWEWATPPAHLHLLTPRGLDEIFSQAGLRTVKLSTRRGDARPFPAEIVIAGAKRLEGWRRGGIGEGASASPPGISRRHRMAAGLTRSSVWLCAPFRPIATIADRWLLCGPEMLAVAAKTA